MWTIKYSLDLRPYLSPSFGRFALNLWHQLSVLFLKPIFASKFTAVKLFLSIFDAQLLSLCGLCTACPQHSVGGTLDVFFQVICVDEVSITSSLLFVAME